MEHSFDIDIAKEYGILEAILLKHIYYWIEKNKANGKHFYEGKHWTYSSINAFAELFPYASAKKIRNSLNKLIELDLIETGNFNTLPFDRTTWYSLTEKGTSIYPKGQMTFAQKGKPIPYINTNNINNNMVILTNDLNELENLFEEFWKLYPKKIKKKDSKRIFLKVCKNIETYELIIKGLNEHLNSDSWNKDNGKYIPYPSTWLNGERWNDEVISKQQKKEVIDYYEYL